MPTAPGSRSATPSRAGTVPSSPAEDWRQAEAFVSEALLGPSRPAFRDVISEVVGPQGNRTLVVSGELTSELARAPG